MKALRKEKNNAQWGHNQDWAVTCHVVCLCKENQKKKKKFTLKQNVRNKGLMDQAMKEDYDYEIAKKI